MVPDLQDSGDLVLPMSPSEFSSPQTPFYRRENQGTPPTHTHTTCPGAQSKWTEKVSQGQAPSSGQDGPRASTPRPRPYQPHPCKALVSSSITGCMWGELQQPHPRDVVKTTCNDDEGLGPGSKSGSLGTVTVLLPLLLLISNKALSLHTPSPLWLSQTLPEAYLWVCPLGSVRKNGEELVVPMSPSD